MTRRSGSCSRWFVVVVLLVRVMAGEGRAAADTASGSESAPAEAEQSAGAIRRPGPDAKAVERWLAWLRERRPAEYERLVRLRAENPAEFEAEMKRRLGEWVRGAAEREAAGHEAAERRMQQYLARIQNLARAYREAPAERREEFREELRQVVTIAFDLQEAERRERVVRLEREVQRLKRELEQRRAAREQMIERKVREILEAEAAAP